MKNNTQERLEEAKNQALRLMKKAGFPIKAEVSVKVDDKLNFMGYTTEANGRPLIVVAKMAVATGSPVGLIVHELGHEYRSEQNHPSHNPKLQTEAVKTVLRGKTLSTFQDEIFGNAMNTVLDIYADDISFQAFGKSFPKNRLKKFFLGWIRMPQFTEDKQKNAWLNSESFLNTAFAQANLMRHKIEDKDNEINSAVQDFLAKSDKKLVKKYDYFKNFLLNLPEKISETEFKKKLIEYLTEFLKLTEA